jgi:Uma2 family endonuclease
LVGAGAFEDERVELLEGVILHRTPPHGPEHDGTIDILNGVLVSTLAGRRRVRVQSAFAASEPDIAVVALGDHRDAHPSAADLIVEVADSSLERDRSRKADVYAASGVPEYWVVDLVHRTVEVRTDPVDGHYTTLLTRKRGDVIALVRLPDVHVAVSDFLR